MWLQGYQKIIEFYDRFSRLDTIPACDRRTGGQTTPHGGKDRAMHSVARVISKELFSLCIIYEQINEYL